MFQEGKPKSKEQIFLEGLKLTSGKKIRLIKTYSFHPSEVEIGTQMEGVLTCDVKIGEPIYLDNKTKVISNISGAGRKDGRIFLKTSTSIYELVIDIPEKINHKILTMKDLEKEIEIYKTKKYDQFDLFNGRVSLDDDPYFLFMKNNKFNYEDKVVYFSDGRERQGTVVDDGKGGHSILDTDGNKNGIMGILSGDGWIKRV